MKHSRNQEGRPKNDDFYTPKWLFDELGLRFDLDVCAPEGGTGLVPADKLYSLKDDGLTSEWHGRVWMNPPFSETNDWAVKFIDHGNGIALLPISKAKWFGLIWDSAHAIKLMPPKFKFERPDGLRKDVFMPLVLVAFGQSNVAALYSVSGYSVKENTALSRTYANELD